MLGHQALYAWDPGPQTLPLDPNLRTAKRPHGGPQPWEPSRRGAGNEPFWVPRCMEETSLVLKKGPAAWDPHVPFPHPPHLHPESLTPNLLNPKP